MQSLHIAANGLQVHLCLVSCCDGPTSVLDPKMAHDWGNRSVYPTVRTGILRWSWISLTFCVLYQKMTATPEKMRTWSQIKSTSYNPIHLWRLTWNLKINPWKMRLRTWKPWFSVSIFNLRDVLLLIQSALPWKRWISASICSRTSCRWEMLKTPWLALSLLMCFITIGDGNG